MGVGLAAPVLESVGVGLAAPVLESVVSHLRVNVAARELFLSLLSEEIKLTPLCTHKYIHT